MIIWINNNWVNELIFRRSKWILIMKLIKILFIFLVLILFILLIFSFKDAIILLSSSLYNLFLVITVFLINYFFLFVLFELTKYFFLLFIFDRKRIIFYSVWKFFSDNIDIINMHEIEDIKFTKDHILNVLLDFWKIIFNDNKLDVKVVYCVDKPEKIVELLMKNNEFEKQKINIK